jgi:hypothetical protein
MRRSRMATEFAELLRTSDGSSDKPLEIREQSNREGMVGAP